MKKNSIESRLESTYKDLQNVDLGGITFNWFPLGLLSDKDVEFINDAIDSGDYARFIAIKLILATVYPGMDFFPEFGLDNKGEKVNILNPIHFAKITNNQVDHSMDCFASFCCH